MHKGAVRDLGSCRFNGYAGRGGLESLAFAHVELDAKALGQTLRTWTTLEFMKAFSQQPPQSQDPRQLAANKTELEAWLNQHKQSNEPHVVLGRQLLFLMDKQP